MLLQLFPPFFEIFLCFCAGVSEGGRLRSALSGEPADEQPKQRLGPRVQGQRAGGSHESAGEGERDAPTEGRSRQSKRTSRSDVAQRRAVLLSPLQLSGQASGATLQIKTEELSRQYNDQLSAMRQEKDQEIQRLRVRGAELEELHRKCFFEFYPPEGKEKLKKGHLSLFSLRPALSPRSQRSRRRSPPARPAPPARLPPRTRASS